MIPPLLLDVHSDSRVSALHLFLAVPGNLYHQCLYTRVELIYVYYSMLELRVKLCDQTIL